MRQRTNFRRDSEKAKSLARGGHRRLRRRGLRFEWLEPRNLLTGSGEISGILWNDLDGDGSRGAGEPPLAGWTVFLDLNGDAILNAGEPSRVTAADGSYAFAGLAPGSYLVGQIAPDDWQPTYPLRTPAGTQVASASGGTWHNAHNDNPAISGDGRFLVFTSYFHPLAPSSRAIVLYDRLTNTYEGIDRGLNGAAANNGGGEPAISADGRFVAFYSVASNLVPGDTNGATDIFVYDRQQGLMERVSVASDGSQGNASSSFGLDISADGRFVAFASRATNLVPGDTNNAGDIFVHDRLTKTTERVSVSGSGVQANGESSFPTISADGRYVAFESTANNLVTGDTNGSSDIFVRDRLLGTTRRVSVSSTGAQGSSSSFRPAISGDGRYVAYWSNASNLVSGDTNGTTDVFVYGLQTGQVQRVSVAATGAQANDSTTVKPALSADGRYVAFSSYASNLVPGDVNRQRDVFVVDRQTGGIRIASLAADGAAANGDSRHFALSGDGQTLAFGSEATNLVPGDNNARRDVFVIPVPGLWRPRAHAVQLAADESRTGVDFGNWQPSGRIAGHVWKDRDRDGLRDVNESGLAGWQVYLDHSGNGGWEPDEPLAVTGGDGAYEFSGLDAGQYAVGLVLPEFWDQTAPGGSGLHTAHVGELQLVTLDFEDLAHAGTSVTIPAYVKDGFVLSTQAASNDIWTVYGPQHASYTGSAALRAAATSTMQWLTRQDGRPFTVQSIDLASLGQTAPQTITFYGTRESGLPVQQTVSVGHPEMRTYALSGFEQIMSLEWRYSFSGSSHQFDNLVLGLREWDHRELDFGSMIHTGQIRGAVWHDRDQDGVWDQDEPPLAGWTVYLDLNDDGQLNPGEPSQQTAGDGSYAFEDLEPGSYVVAEVLPSGWQQTHPGTPALAATHQLELAPGEIVEDIDFGNFGLPVEIAGTKWNDLNGNGLRDPGEPGLAGIPLYLDLNGNGQWDAGEPRTLSTEDDPATPENETGNYRFTELLAGTYLVAEDAPPQWQQTWPAAPQVTLQQLTLDTYTMQQVLLKSEFPSISGDGRFVAFESTETELVGGDSNGRKDLFVYDRSSGVFERISVGYDGSEANGISYEAAISQDGRWVAFVSQATNLVPGLPSTASRGWLYLYDRQTGETRCLSVTSTGEFSDGIYRNPAISADGRFIAYASSATTLIPGDTNRLDDVFIHDRLTGQVEVISVTPNGLPGANGPSSRPVLSDDGRYVGFISSATNLIAGRTTQGQNFFVRDRQAQTTELVSIASDGTLANDSSMRADLSGDGRFAVFTSTVASVVPGDSNNVRDVFFRDLHSGQTRVVSTNFAGQLGNAASFAPRISRDGRYVTFTSDASNLVPGDTNGRSDVFRHDTLTGAIVRVSSAPDGSQGTLPSETPAISADGRWVVYRGPGHPTPVQGYIMQGLMLADLRPSSAALPIAYTVSLSHGEHREGLDFGNHDGLPVVSWIERLDADPTAAMIVRFAVEFSEEVTGVDISDFQLISDGVVDAAVAEVSGSGRSYQVTVATGRHNGTLRLDLIDDDSILDAAGNPLGGNGPGNGHFTGPVYEIVKPPTGEIHGAKWNDLNGDGVRDAGEPGLAGWTVFLDLDGDGLWDPGEPFTLTDADGNYALEFVPPGLYSVRAAPQAGWELTAPISRVEIERIAPTESVADNTGNLAAISGDGRYVAFRSTASDLVPGDTNGRADIFVLDRQQGTIERVSVSSSGAEADGDSFDPSISGDGRLIAFRSAATNLVAGDTNVQHDIFVHDRQTGETRRVSVSSQGVQSDGFSLEAHLNAAGTHVVFSSLASTLVPGDTNSRYDTFVYDLTSETIQRVSVRSDGGQGNAHSWGGTLSADGSLVVFESTASNLVDGDTNGAGDLFLRDPATGDLQIVSLTADGGLANGAARKRWLSGDGRYLVFESLATNMVPGDTNGHRDIFLLDLQTGVLQRISSARDGTQSNGDSAFPQISGDGRWVVFESTATNLTDVPTSGVRNLYRYDRLEGSIQLITTGLGGVSANGHSYRPYINYDGSQIAFHSGASNLVADDINSVNDVFVARLNEHPDSARHVVWLVSGQTITGRDFASRDVLAPAMVATSPAAGSVGVPQDLVLEIAFSEPVQKGAGSVVLHRADDGAVVETIAIDSPAVTVAGATASIQLSQPLAPATEYYVEVSSGGFRDLAGHDFAGISGPGEWSFVSQGVLARWLFYNGSYFDGNNSAANAADDQAIAADKTPLLPGGTAGFANYSSYSRGINGIMLDLVNAVEPGWLDPARFQFLVGNSDAPADWSVASAPISITVRPGAGIGGADRLTIIWADRAIKNQWLQVTVQADAVSGLSAPDVFYFGNAVGESGNNPSNAYVDGSDFAAARDNPRNALNRAAIDSPYDYNRDSYVDGSDLALVRDNATNFVTALRLITVPATAGQELPLLALGEGEQQSGPPEAEVVAERELAPPIPPWSGRPATRDDRPAQLAQPRGEAPPTDLYGTAVDRINGRPAPSPAERVRGAGGHRAVFAASGAKLQAQILDELEPLLENLVHDLAASHVR